MHKHFTDLDSGFHVALTDSVGSPILSIHPIENGAVSETVLFRQPATPSDLKALRKTVSDAYDDDIVTHAELYGGLIADQFHVGTPTRYTLSDEPGEEYFDAADVHRLIYAQRLWVDGEAKVRPR